jgi:branched-chain amino acid transport system permease protein
MRPRAARRTLSAALAAALLLFPAVVVQPYPRDVMIKVFLYALLAQAWNLLGGYCGQISLGNAVFFGIGAYTSSVLGLEAGLSPWLGMAAGMLLAVAVSQVIGYPCFRLRGHYFAIATIAVGEIVQTIVLNWDAVGGARGINLPLKPETLADFQFHRAKWPYYYIALGLFAAVFGLTALVERSRLGYYFRAIREDPDAAQSLGVPLTRYKLMAIALSAAFSALGGTFYAQYVLFIDPESVFPLTLSILICLVAVLGGVGTLWGPLLGAVILIPLSEATRVYYGGTGKAVDLMIYGGLIVLVAVFQPGGLAALLGRAARPRPRAA